MGSHYIKVGNLKLDQDLMNLICPAAGFTPENICPANGYIPDPGATYVPAVDIGTPSTEEIYLLCTDAFPHYIALRCILTSGQYYAEIYDENGGIVEITPAVNSNTNFEYFFPTQGEGKYYKIKLKPSSSNTFTKFYTTASSGYPAELQILQAKFNTPGLTELYNAFKDIRTIKSVTFECTLNYLARMDSMFYNAGIQYFYMPQSLPELTTLANCFYNAYIVKIDGLLTASLPKLTTLSGFANLASDLVRLDLPPSLPELTTMYNMLYRSGVRFLTMPVSASKVTTLAQMCYECFFLQGEVIVPEMQLCVTVATAFYSCYKLEKLKFTGAFSVCNNMSSLIYNNYTLEEFEFPRTLSYAAQITMTNFMANTKRLQKLVLPDSWTSSAITQFSSWYPTHFFKTISGEMNNVNAILNIVTTSKYLESVNCPGLRSSSINIGLSSALSPATYIEIDWANSTFVEVSGGCIKLHCQLVSSEINRIFTALPTVTGGQSIDVRYCPGYATCNPSIATGKGWTVL